MIKSCSLQCKTCYDNVVIIPLAETVEEISVIRRISCCFLSKSFQSGGFVGGKNGTVSLVVNVAFFVGFIVDLAALW